MGLIPLALRWRGARPVLGVLVAAACVGAATSLAALLTRVAPAHALNVVYLPGLLLTAYVWGLPVGLPTALASTVAFDLFVTGPAWSLWSARGEFVGTLAIFLVVALLAGVISGLYRSLAKESEARTDADLSAQLAGL